MRAPPRGSATARSLAVRIGVRLIFAFLLLGLMLFGIAGTTDWPGAWITLGVMAVCLAINLTVLVPVNPEVVEERLAGKGAQPRWDILLVSLMTVGLLGATVVAALDRRFGWSWETRPAWLLAGALLALLGDLVFLWALAVNKFFARQVRIQRERGHTTVSSGPYRYVRHPGYVGWIVLFTGFLLLLGSWWSFLPFGLSVAMLVLRTSLEDRLLWSELEGYADYARRVRYRLLPGLW
jgi:protein-S-isoprenylcysteine O-methyltransferase Ste14